MKKLFSILLSILLVSTLAFSVTACKKTAEESVDLNEVPVTITIKTEKEDDETTVTLTEISLSAAAKSFIDDKKIDDLKNLFDSHGTPDTKCFTFANGEVTFTIPSNVTHIGANAVSNLSFINHIVVGENVVEIAEGAFPGLSGLKSITLPFVGGKVGAVNSAKLFAYIFGTIGGDGLTSITQTFNEVSTNTASLCVPTSLKKVTITGDVKTTTKTRKYYNNSDNKPVPVADDYADATIEVNGETYTVYSVTTKDYSESAVQPYAFHGVTTIEEVVFGGEITEIPEYTFYGCAGIKKLDFTGSTITSIGKYAYANCTSLRVLTLGSVVTLAEGAFSGCTSLGKNTETTVNTLAITGVTLGKDAFAGCSSLTEEKLDVDFSALSEDEQKALEDAFGEEFFETEDEEENA